MAFADIAKDDHRADESAPVSDRCRGVFDPEAGAVLAEELLVFDMVDGAVAEGGVDRTLLMRVRTAVGAMVMDDRVHVAAHQLAGVPAQHRFGRRVDEGRLAFRIDAEDAFARRAQDELVAAFDVLEQPLRALPLAEAAPNMVFRLRVEIAPVAGVEIVEGQENGRVGLRQQP